MPSSRISVGHASQDGGALIELSEKLWTWLTMDALPLWWRLGADHNGGGYYETLDHNGAPNLAPRRCRVQPRQIYSFALAAAAGWDGPATEAAEHGLAFFLSKYRRADGLFRTCVAPDGSPIDERAVLYDQAFALLGLYGGYSLTKRAELADLAKSLVDRILQHFKHQPIGFREDDGSPFQSNAQMHLFEACIAWGPVLGGAFTHTGDELAELCLRRLIDAERGCIDEFYDAEWRPAGPTAADPQRRVEPGHQFEWAWLLAQWGGIRGRDTTAPVRRLFEIGEASVQVATNAAPAAITPDGALAEPVARLWPQTERMRTAAWLAAGGTGDAEEYARAAHDAALCVLRYLDMPMAGLWRDKLRSDGTFVDEPAPASSLYHLATAVTALKSLVLDAAVAADEPA